MSEYKKQAADIIAILTENGLGTRRERAGFVAKLRDKFGLKYKQIGKQLNVSPQRAHQLYILHKIFSRPDFAMESEDELVSKEFTAPLPPEDAMQKVAEFFNTNNFRGEFKVWPKGTLPGAEDYDFSMTVSDYLANAWEEQWDIFRQFESMLKPVGYEYDVEGEPGQKRVFNFFRFTL